MTPSTVDVLNQALHFSLPKRELGQFCTLAMFDSTQQTVPCVCSMADDFATKSYNENRCQITWVTKTASLKQSKQRSDASLQAQNKFRRTFRASCEGVVEVGEIGGEYWESFCSQLTGRRSSLRIGSPPESAQSSSSNTKLGGNIGLRVYIWPFIVREKKCELFYILSAHP